MGSRLSQGWLRDTAKEHLNMYGYACFPMETMLTGYGYKDCAARLDEGLQT